MMFVLFVLFFAIGLPSHSQTAEVYVLEGRSFLASKNLTNALQRFQQAVKLQPNNETAQALFGATRLLALLERPEVQQLLTRASLSTNGRSCFEWKSAPQFDTNRVPMVNPSMNAMEPFQMLRSLVANEVGLALTNFARINSPQFILTLQDYETGYDLVNVDYADVQLLISGLHFIRSTFLLLGSWDFSVTWSRIRSGWDTDLPPIQQLMSEFTGFLANASPEVRALAKDELNKACLSYLKASPLIRIRNNQPDRLDRLFGFGEDLEAEEDFHQQVVAVRNSLVAPTVFPSDPDETLFLAPLFEPVNSPRRFAPKFKGNKLVSGTWPDRSFGGIVKPRSEQDLAAFVEQFTDGLAVNPTSVAPAIDVQPPAAVMVTVGQSAQLSVTVSGTAPLSYQWQRNGVNVAGGNGAALTIANAQSADAGDFRVVVSNTAGSVTSAVSKLTVKREIGVLIVRTNGFGTISPNIANAQLEIGTQQTVSAVPAPGWVLRQWTSNLLPPTNRNPLSFKMAKDLEITAHFVDVQKPVVVVASPSPNQRVVTNSATWQVRGTTSDNGSVSNVWVSLNKGAWRRAEGIANWGVTMPLVAGLNEIAAYAEDAYGNRSVTNGVLFTYVVTAPLTLKTNGSGTISPNIANAQLEIGTQQTVSAVPAPGWVLRQWTSNLLPPTNRNPLSFKMAKDLEITAHFVDVQKPVVVVTSPSPNSLVRDPIIPLKISATDNGGPVQVWWRLNDGPWQQTAPEMGSFSVDLYLNPGVNLISTYGVDLAGNSSSTNSLEVTCLEGIAKLYLPLNDGDRYEWDGPKGLYFGYISTKWGESIFTQSEPNEPTVKFGVRHDERGESIYWTSAQSEEWDRDIGSIQFTYELNPPVQLFSPEIFANGGTMTKTASANIQFYIRNSGKSGTLSMSIQSVFKVAKVGTMTVPLGTFRQVRQADWIVTASYEGKKSILTQMTMFLAPKVGPIRVSDYSADNGGLKFEGWINLVDGRVGGVDVRELVGPLSGIGIPLETQQAILPQAAPPEQQRVVSDTPQLEWMQDGAGVERLVLIGRLNHVYHIERGLQNAEGVVQWELHSTVVIPEGERLEISVDPARPASWYRAVEH